MYPAAETSWYPFARRLAREGFTAMTFNFRGYGMTSGPKDISKIDQDLRFAVDVLKREGVERVFLIGASMGGTAAVMVAANTEVAGVVTLSAPRAFQGLDATFAAPKVTAPKLFIATREDVPARRSASWFLEASPEPKGLRLLPGAAHGTQLLEREQRQEVEELLLAFLRDPEGTLERD